MSPRPIHTLLLLLLAIQTPVAAEEENPTAVVADRKQISNLSAPNWPEKILKGTASVERSVWQKHYDAGTKALESRQFQVAERKLQLALSELRRSGSSDNRFLMTKLCLAEALLGQDRFQDADHMFADSAARSSHNQGGNTAEHARALVGWAQCETALGRPRKAQQLAKTAIPLSQRALGPKSLLTGKAEAVLAEAYAAEGLDEDAESHYRAGIAILEENPGYRELDLAEASYRLGMLLESRGERDEGDALIEKALLTKDRAVTFNQSPLHQGLVKYQWQEGCPRSRQIHDPDYPLKYINIGGVRVATTIVRSENVIVGLISLANCTKNRIEIAIGPVGLEQLQPTHKDFRQVHHTELDIVLETEHVSNLTWRRRWLNHIQKSRNIPGYLKNGVLDTDNFFGPNVFSSI